MDPITYTCPYCGKTYLYHPRSTNLQKYPKTTCKNCHKVVSIKPNSSPSSTSNERYKEIELDLDADFYDELELKAKEAQLPLDQYIIKCVDTVIARESQFRVLIINENERQVLLSLLNILIDQTVNQQKLIMYNLMAKNIADQMSQENICVKCGQAISTTEFKVVITKDGPRFKCLSCS
jgi:hypothetical protein